MQLRSRVCPSVTAADEVSILTGGVTPMAGGGSGVSHRVPIASPCHLPPIPGTVRGAGAGLDGDDEGRLVRDTARCHPAHVLARIGRRHLGDAQAGARHLGR